MVKVTRKLKNNFELPLNSSLVLKRRYLLKDDNRNTTESPSELFRRVAFNIAQAERGFKSRASVYEVESKFYEMMSNLEFMPNSPTLMNAGTSFGQLSACFVLPVGDSIDSIFEALRCMAKIHQTGGGTGFSFSHLRSRRALVSSTKGEASGPVSFMKIFDKATEVIVQGGRRRGANMGVLRCDHPDIVEFAKVKKNKDEFRNFNLSVGVTDKFMKAVESNSYFDLLSPLNNRKVKSIKARELFNIIIDAAYHSGDPGLIFLDEINRKQPTPQIGKIESTNPCGELPLLPYESCCLASINLSKMTKGPVLEWEKLKDIVWWGIRFLDNVIEVNKFPLAQIKEITFANRKIGLGVMGFADMLIRLGIPYTAKEAVVLAERLMRFIHAESIKASVDLAVKRGVFPNFKRSIYTKKNLRLRNATVNTIAPTGTISIIAGCSSGIEPLFAISFVRNVLSGAQLFEINPIFEETAKKRGFYNKEVFREIARRGSLQDVKGIPRDVKRVFVTAFDVKPQQHLRIQAAFQKHTDNSVSKTINLLHNATVEDIRKIYILAHKLKCKGITVYRYGSNKGQVLSFNYRAKKTTGLSSKLVSVGSEYSGGCYVRTCPF